MIGPGGTAQAVSPAGFVLTPSAATSFVGESCTYGLLRGRSAHKRSGQAMAAADYFPPRPADALHREAK